MTIPVTLLMMAAFVTVHPCFVGVHLFVLLILLVPFFLQNLLAWLLKKKSQGFWIVGLEQTSSSLPIQEVKMPHQQPTVLLLGKEKEGIPVQFLHTVDQCIEIPQFGIIRSLNVHVSGAIAIWEFTRQTRLKTDR